MTNKNISELTLKAKIALHDPKKNKILCCGHFLIARIIGKEHKCTFYYRPFHQKYMYKLGEYPELSLKEARVKLNQLEKKEEEKYFSKYEIIDKTEDTLKQVEQDKTFKKVARKNT